MKINVCNLFKMTLCLIYYFSEVKSLRLKNDKDDDIIIKFSTNSEKVNKDYFDKVKDKINLRMNYLKRLINGKFLFYKRFFKQ